MNTYVKKSEMEFARLPSEHTCSHHVKKEVVDYQDLINLKTLLKFTFDCCFIFQPDVKFSEPSDHVMDPDVFVDSDWAGFRKTRRSLALLRQLPLAQHSLHNLPPILRPPVRARPCGVPS